MNKVRKRLLYTLSLFVLAHFSHHIITAITVPLLPLIRSTFDLSYTQSGFLLSAFTLTYGLAHLPSGWISDRIGPVILITTGIVGVALGGLLAGLAGSFTVLIIAHFVMGIAGSGYHPAASYFISRATPPEKRGRALGVHVIGGSASYFLSPLLAAAIASAWSWRGSFITLAIPTVLLGLVLGLLLPRASQARNRQDEPRDKEQTSSATAVPGARFIAFLVLTTLNGAAIGSVIGFIPLYLVDAFGIKDETAAGLLAIIFSAGIWAAPLAGILSDRVARLPIIITVSFIAGPVVLLLSRVPLGIGFYVLLLLVGIFLFVRMPVSEAYIFGEVPRRFRSTMLGVYFFGSSIGGGVLTPIMGWLIDRYGFGQGFLAAGAFLFALTLICSAVILGSHIIAHPTQ